MKPRSANATRSRIAQAVAFGLFRLATYCVIAAASYIFLDIGIKGSRTLFMAHAPFVNFTFLTDRPQTLYVFDFDGQKMTLGDQDFREWQKVHPTAAVEPQTVAYSA